MAAVAIEANTADWHSDVPESALTSADFISDGRQPFTRIAEGSLVDFEDYIPYFADEPGRVPTKQDPTPNHKTPGGHFVAQHAYFRELTYTQTGLPQAERDRRLVALRNSPHSQIVMRKYLELQLHLDKEGDVEPPTEEVRDGVLKDYFDIDIVEAAILGVQEAKHPRSVKVWQYRKTEPPPEIQALTAKQKIEIFKSARDEALDRLQNPLVVPKIVIDSALKRSSIDLQDLTLARIAAERMEGEEFYYPLLTPSRGSLRTVTSYVLKDAVGLMPLDEARQYVQTLQTGVGQLELVRN